MCAVVVIDFTCCCSTRCIQPISLNPSQPSVAACWLSLSPLPPSQPTTTKTNSPTRRRTAGRRPIFSCRAPGRAIAAVGPRWNNRPTAKTKERRMKRSEGRRHVQTSFGGKHTILLASDPSLSILYLPVEGWEGGRDSSVSKPKPSKCSKNCPRFRWRGRGSRAAVVEGGGGGHTEGSNCSAHPRRRRKKRRKSRRRKG